MTRMSAAAVDLLTRSGRTFDVRISGVSMGDTIPDGATVRVEPVEPAALRRGDVVAYREDDRIVAHRLWFRARKHSVLVGDGYELPDLPVADHDVMGRVTAIADAGVYREIAPRRTHTFHGRLTSLVACAALLVSPRLARMIAAAALRLRWRHGSTTAKRRSHDRSA